MDREQFVVGLVGNPNSGKSTLFNRLTGLRQKVSNYPGVTVDKKEGSAQIDEFVFNVIDFPGTYSLHPSSQDERVVLNVFANPQNKDYPDLVVYVADVQHMEKHFLLLSQILDLNVPVILALNKIDAAEEQGGTIDLEYLRKQLQIPVVTLSGKYGTNLDELQAAIKSFRLRAKNNEIGQLGATAKALYQASNTEKNIHKQLQKQSLYHSLLTAHHYAQFNFLDDAEKVRIAEVCAQNGFNSLDFQVRETMQRFDNFVPMLQKAIRQEKTENKTFTDKLDALFTHNVWGPIIFCLFMVLVFQAIFSWAAYPMDLIDALFGKLRQLAADWLPQGWLNDLLTEGILAGLGGIVIFIPQIAILFFLIAVMEETGYMARAVYLFDKVMQKFGLNGRSIVALISGGACAIPAIMSTRTISSWKERLITIMITPLISCSARIPVYAILIALVVPSKTVLGVFNQQALVFMGLYLLGITGALLSALVFKAILKPSEPSYLALILPNYAMPAWKNILLTVKEKVITFVVEAGRVILVISVVLWVLASYGPGGQMEAAQNQAETYAQAKGLSANDTEHLIAAKKLEASYAGNFGKLIEPVIAPLGFDWKMGIALITSFAAREVFVGTMATLYSIGNGAEAETLRQKMASETNPETGKKTYTLATGFSLLIFYVFAMQCMATLAVVRRETGTWKWAALQLVFMTVLAYVGSLLMYNLLK